MSKTRLLAAASFLFLVVGMRLMVSDVAISESGHVSEAAYVSISLFWSFALTVTGFIGGIITYVIVELESRAADETETQRCMDEWLDELIVFDEQ